MKIIRYTTLLILSLSLSLNAEEIESIIPSVKELLSQVKKAPDIEKRVLINQLKMRLKTMNSQSRKEAMRELKRSFSGKKMQQKEMLNRGGKQHTNNPSHSCNHQPKFRHLQQGLRNGSGTGNGQGLGNGHQGVGHK